MAYIRQIEEAEADGLLESIYEAGKQREGSVANIIRVMSQDARSTQASMAFYVALMKSSGSLHRTQREMLATVVSNINDCYY